ncbi:MAG: amino acid racemase [Gordonia sp. (in: high G+C Gram-positive bacteria)]|uniref:aspartate/glutamate racemase family protein n=1 Tax=Gordonia sp. (in: high G+C Gram-positive bacteria) TaxID=84139 RepID=UPI0039E551F0
MIGGTGPESTVSYYRAVIEGVQEIAGEQTLPPLIIESLSVFRVLDFCARNDLDGLTDYLAAAIDGLARAGADVASLTALTPHIVFDRLVARSPIPLISAIDATRDEALARGARCLVLLGTAPTMTHDFFARPLREAGLTVVVPDPEEIDYIQDKIVTELEHGVVLDATRTGFTRIVSRLHERHGADHVVLGCTELPLLLDDRVSPLPCLDPVAAHTRRLVAAIV